VVGLGPSHPPGSIRVELLEGRPRRDSPPFMSRLLGILLLLSAGLASAAKTVPVKPPETVPVKPSFLREYAETRRFASGLPSNVRILPSGEAVLFLRAQPRSPVQTLFLTDLKTGQTRELLTPESLLKGAAQTLSTAEKARLERMRISARGFTSYQLSQDGKYIVVSLSGRLYLVEWAGGAVQELQTGPGVLDPKFSPDGKSLAYVRENDLFVLELSTQKERRLTTGSTEKKTHGLAEFVAQEEMGRFSGYWWSPDSKWISYEEVDNSPVEVFSIMDLMHPEKPADTFPYPRPGKANAQVRLGVISAQGGETRWIPWDTEKYPYLATVVWAEGGPLSFLVQNRHQTEEVLYAVDTATGQTRVLVSEKDDAWLNLKQQFPLWMEDGSGFLWFTERNGDDEVEWRAPSGELKGSWVKPGQGFAALSGYDKKDGWLYFTGGTNPTESALFRVKFGGVPERVDVGEKGPSSVSAGLSKEGAVLFVNTSSMSHLPQSHVRRPDGTLLAELPSVAVTPPFLPNVETLKVGEGEGLFAQVFRPHDFKKGKKLPVIVEVYGGPHALTVGQSLSLLSQWMADQGFLVVRLDNRGTPRRGRAWERSIKGDFAGPALEDQVAGLKALSQKIPELDLGRVGITGWSFGGYMSALAVLKRPDVFKAAVAGAPVVDWLDYDTHYTERYLGLPQESPEAYARSSLLTYAKDLQRPLLLIHGTADDNVYFLHTLKLSDALFKAGKPHELLPLSGLTHMVPDPLVTERLQETVIGYFKKHL